MLVKRKTSVEPHGLKIAAHAVAIATKIRTTSGIYVKTLLSVVPSAGVISALMHAKMAALASPDLILKFVLNVVKA